MNERIAVLAPTRYRPESLLRMVQSAHDTATLRSKVVFGAYIDDDDPMLDDYVDLWKVLPAWVRFTVKKRTTLSDTWNALARDTSADILMMCADDVVFRTEDWDEIVRQEFRKYPDRIVLVYGNDGVSDEKMATHPFVHRRWVETVGRFVPPYFSADHCDLWLHDVAKTIDRLYYVPSLTFEHLHPSVGKAPIDRCHEERLERLKNDKPYEIYVQKVQERVEEAAKLREAMA